MTLALRDSALEDGELVFAWRNHEEVRRFSFSDAEIDWETHQRWFKDIMMNPDRRLLIAELDSTPVGVLRFDVTDQIGEVSIFLAPGLAGKGIGTEILRLGAKWAKRHLNGVRQLKARIKPDNYASQKAFAKAGFTELSGVLAFNLAGEEIE